MTKSASSRRWLDEHHGDPYVQEAQRSGYRSRAAFKLQAIDQQDQLLRPGLTVVDLGAAPGGWSQLAAERVGPAGRVIAIDILTMPPLSGVTCLQGDFREQAMLEQLLSLAGEGVDRVLSDMAPNVTGQKSVDQPRAMYLAELAADFARQVLKPDGQLLVKLFHGQGFDAYLQELRAAFGTVRIRKPQASRARSSEVYALAREPQGVSAS